MNVLGFFTPRNVPTDAYKVKADEGIIHRNKNELKLILLIAVNNPSGVFIDRVELYEYCTELLTRQVRNYRYASELEEANNIIAGSVIGNTNLGEVRMFDRSVTKYKANTKVKLVQGFGCKTWN